MTSKLKYYKKLMRNYNYFLLYKLDNRSILCNIKANNTYNICIIFLILLIKWAMVKNLV